MDELSRDVDGVVPVEVMEDRLFDGFREQVESMIVWARTDAVLAMEHAPLEEQALAEAFKAVQLLTEAHMMVRPAREQRRGCRHDPGRPTPPTAQPGPLTT